MEVAGRGRGIAYIAISWPIFCCWRGRGRGVGRSKYSYSTVSCSVSVYYTCLYHYVVSTSLLFVYYTCLLDSVAIRAPLYSTVRSPFWFSNCCQPLLPVPGSVDCYFSHSVPGRYRPSRANLLRFCEFCGFQSIFFIVVSSGCSGPSVCVFVVLFMLCRGSRWLPKGLISVRSVYLVLLLLNCVQWFSYAILIVLIIPYRYIFTYFLFALKLRFSEPWYWTKKSCKLFLQICVF